MSRCVFKIYNLVFNTYDVQEGMSLALREMRVDQVGNLSRQLGQAGFAYRKDLVYTPNYQCVLVRNLPN